MAQEKITVRQLSSELKVKEESLLAFLHNQGFDEYKFSTLLNDEIKDILIEHKEEFEAIKKNEVYLTPPFTVKEIAEAINEKPHKLVEEFIKLDVFATINQTIDPSNAEKTFKDKKP